MLTASHILLETLWREITWEGIYLANRRLWSIHGGEASLGTLLINLATLLSRDQHVVVVVIVVVVVDDNLIDNDSDNDEQVILQGLTAVLCFFDRQDPSSSRLDLAHQRRVPFQPKTIQGLRGEEGY